MDLAVLRKHHDTPIRRYLDIQQQYEHLPIPETD